MPELTGQTETSKAASLTAACQAAGKPGSWRQGGAGEEQAVPAVLGVGTGLAPLLRPRGLVPCFLSFLRSR